MSIIDIHCALEVLLIVLSEVTSSPILLHELLRMEASNKGSHSVASRLHHHSLSIVVVGLRGSVVDRGIARVAALILVDRVVDHLGRRRVRSVRMRSVGVRNMRMRSVLAHLILFSMGDRLVTTPGYSLGLAVVDFLAWRIYWGSGRGHNSMHWSVDWPSGRGGARRPMVGLGLLISYWLVVLMLRERHPLLDRHRCSSK